MKLNYFNQSFIKSLEDLKKEYKKLARKYHPDITGKDTNQEMADINNEYEYLFNIYKNVKFNHQENKYYESKEETTETQKDFINIIDELIKVKNILIEVCGSWLWVSGTTYPIKETLKDLTFKYSKNKKAWYLHYDVYKKNNNKTFSLEEIRELWGSNAYQNEQVQLLLA